MIGTILSEKRDEILYVEQLDLKRRSREGEGKQNKPSSGDTKITQRHSGAVTKDTVGTRFLTISFFVHMLDIKLPSFYTKQLGLSNRLGHIY